jgi:hypothetical protein
MQSKMPWIRPLDTQNGRRWDARVYVGGDQLYIYKTCATEKEVKKWACAVQVRVAVVQDGVRSFARLPAPCFTSTFGKQITIRSTGGSSWDGWLDGSQKSAHLGQPPDGH